MPIGDLLRPRRPLGTLAAVLTDLRNRVAGCMTNLAAVLTDTAHILAHLRELKEQIMTTKQEILDQLADVKTVLTETAKDVKRVADRLDQAVADNNLDEVAAAVAELKQMAQQVDDRAEQSAPEPTTGDADTGSGSGDQSAEPAQP